MPTEIPAIAVPTIERSSNLAVKEALEFSFERGETRSKMFLKASPKLFKAYAGLDHSEILLEDARAFPMAQVFWSTPRTDGERGVGILKVIKPSPDIVRLSTSFPKCLLDPNQPIISEGRYNMSVLGSVGIVDGIKINVKGVSLSVDAITAYAKEMRQFVDKILLTMCGEFKVTLKVYGVERIEV